MTARKSARPAKAASAKSGMKVSADAALQTRGGGAREEGVNPFVLSKPAPGVLPARHKGMAMDDSLSSLFGWAVSSAVSEGLAFPGYAVLAQMTQRAEYRRPAEILAKEMTRKWIRLQAVGEEDKSERIRELEACCEAFNFQQVVRKAVELDGYFGRAQIFIDLTGRGARGDDGELAKPLALTPRKVPRGSLQALTVVEPMWTYPDAYNSTDPLAKDYYRPTSWFVMATRVHASRLCTIISRPVPDILKPAYMFGGLSLSQISKPYVDNWLRTRQSVADLIRSFTTWVLKTDMSAMLTGGAATDVINRAQIFNQLRDNRGLMMVNKDSEELANVAAPLGGLDSLQAQTQEHLSSVSGIPLSVLLGITPHGLNASSEGEMRAFFDWIEASQESSLDAHVAYILKVMQLHLWGEVDEGITHAWEPLWTMTAKERAEIDKSMAEADSIRINDGVVSPHEVRVRVADDPDSPYKGLNLDPAFDPTPPAEEAEPSLEEMMGGGAEPGSTSGASPAPGAKPEPKKPENAFGQTKPSNPHKLNV